MNTRILPILLFGTFVVILAATAQAAPARANLSVAAHSFDVVTLGKKKTFSFSLRNFSRKKLTIRKISLSGTDRKSFTVKPKGLLRTIPARGRIRIPVYFAPKRVGSLHAVLLVTTSAGKLSASLSGFCSDGKGPRILGASPESGIIGTTILINGYGFGGDPSAIQVFFEDHPAVVLSVSTTLITAQIPTVPSPRWDGKYLGHLWARKNGVDIPLSQTLYFTVTGLPPKHPLFYAPRSQWLNNASVGDTVFIYGQGFSSQAERNVLSFNGVKTVAATYKPDPLSSLEYDGFGTISVIVPEGATTGPLLAKRLDGYPNDWGEGFTFTIHPRSGLSLSAGREAAGVINPYPYVSSEQEILVLSGSGFSKVWDGVYSTRPQLLADFQTASGSGLGGCFVVSDNEVDCQLRKEEWSALNVVPGATLSVRVKGQERTNLQWRYSNWVNLPVRTKSIAGGVWEIAVNYPYTSSELPIRIPRGDLVALGRYTGTNPKVTAGCLWDGTLTLPTDAIGAAKTVVASEAGNCTLSDTATGWSIPIQILNDGRGAAQEFTVPNLADDGFELGFGGARVRIPSGALPKHDGSAQYTITATLEENSQAPTDPEQTNGDRSFSVLFSPEPPELLKPITMILPYSAADRATEPRFGLWDSTGRFFLPLAGATLDDDLKKLTFVLPAAKYPPPPAAGSTAVLQTAAAVPASTVSLLPVKLNQITGNMAVVSNRHREGLIEDDEHRLWVDYITDTTSSSYVPKVFAETILSLAVTTYQNLADNLWPRPGSQVTVYIRNMGAAKDIQGSTTTGVFGQPWVTVNSNLLSWGDDKLTYSGVGHEIGHLFQRQLTTNATLTGASWLDEGAADWTAFNTFGLNRFSTTAMAAGTDFATVTFPKSFKGFNPEQNYGVSAFAIWLEDKCLGCGPAPLLTMYQTLRYDPWYWFDSRGTVAAATGKAFSTVLHEFALDYWLQKYEPIKAFALEAIASHRKFNAWSGVLINETRPAYSSKRFSIELDPALSGLQDHYGVARSSALNGFEEIHIFGDPLNSVNSPPSDQLTELATLRSGEDNEAQGLGDGKKLGTYKSYRVIVTNASASDTAPAISIVAPHIDHLQPPSGSRTAGGMITIYGNGFGTKKGTVYFAGQTPQAVTWKDTEVTFQKPGLPSGGSVPVRLTTAEGVDTLNAYFTAS